MRSKIRVHRGRAVPAIIAAGSSWCSQQLLVANQHTVAFSRSCSGTVRLSVVYCPTHIKVVTFASHERGRTATHGTSLLQDATRSSPSAMARSFQGGFPVEALPKARHIPKKSRRASPSTSPSRSSGSSGTMSAFGGGTAMELPKKKRSLRFGNAQRPVRSLEQRAFESQGLLLPILARTLLLTLDTCARILTSGVHRSLGKRDESSARDTPGPKFNDVPVVAWDTKPGTPAAPGAAGAMSDTPATLVAKAGPRMCKELSNLAFSSPGVKTATPSAEIFSGKIEEACASSHVPVPTAQSAASFIHEQMSYA
jgi:hypothetical protein